MRAMTWRKLAGASLVFGFVAVAVPLAGANPPTAPHPHTPHPKGNTVAGPHHTGTPASAANTHAVLANLHQAHGLLVAANHDYDGHRAKAAEAVKQAIHELGGQHHQSHSVTYGAAHHIALGIGAGIGGNAKVHEPQAISDAQLRQAGQML